MPASHFENQTTGTSWCCNILREAESNSAEVSWDALRGISPRGGSVLHSDSPAALSEPFSFYLGGIVSAQMADCSLPIIPGLFSRKRISCVSRRAGHDEVTSAERL